MKNDDIEKITDDFDRISNIPIKYHFFGFIKEFDKDEENETMEKEFMDLLLMIILPIMIVGDILYLPESYNWGASIVIGILQIIFLVAFFPRVRQMFKQILAVLGRGK